MRFRVGSRITRELRSVRNAWNAWNETDRIRCGVVMPYSLRSIDSMYMGRYVTPSFSLTLVSART